MRVLFSLQGGGVRGVQSAVYIEAFEHISGHSIASVADLVVGTSTGALCAAALTAPIPKTGAQLVDLYEDRAKEIFARPWQRSVSTVAGLFGPKYDNKGLFDVCTETVGTGPMAGVKAPCMITAYDLKARAPKMFKSWGDDSGTPLAFAAVASASAPVYFPSFHDLVDGGLFANDPVMCGIVELMAIHKCPASEIAVLSFGTGGHDKPIKESQWGLAGWATNIVDSLLDGAEGVADYQARQIGLGAYLRLNAPLGANPDSGMDDASPGNLAALSNVARKVVMLNTENLLAWLDKAGIKQQ